MAERDWLETPADYSEPNWHGKLTVHEWKNYITDELEEMWPSFTDEQRAAIARNAYDIAMREFWD